MILFANPSSFLKTIGGVMKKNIFVIVMETNELSGPNSGLSLESIQALKKISASIKEHLPLDPPAIISGISRAEMTAVRVLDIKPTHYSAMCGLGLAASCIDDKIVLPSMIRVNPDMFIWPDYSNFLRNLSHNSILIADNYFLTATKILSRKVSCVLVKLEIDDDILSNIEFETEFDIISGEVEVSEPSLMTLA